MKFLLTFASLILSPLVLADFTVHEIPQGGGLRPHIAVASSEGSHFLYDPNELKNLGIWTGPFDPDADGPLKPSDATLKSFSLARAPWSFGELKRRELTHEWLGHEVRDDKLWLKYRAFDKASGMSWDIEENLEIVSPEIQRLHFNIKPGAKTDLYLNYWVTQTDFRRVSSNGQPNQRNKLKNLFPNQTQFTLTFIRRKETPTMPHGYAVETIPIPTPAAPYLFEPSDITFAKNGDVYTSTRTGQIWRRHNEEWSIFADGLQEANGIRMTPDGDGVIVMQKPELTLLKDTDSDGVADEYLTLEDRFRYTGHYHEFAYGPRLNSAGDMFFSTGLASSGFHLANPDQPRNQMTSALGYRGWVMKRHADGRITPFAAGLRSPAGIGINAQDELFVTDNQGDWVASSYLGHVEEGDFLGHPAALWDRPEYGLTPHELSYKNVTIVPKKVPPLDQEKFTRERKHPAVWLAHNDLTNSPGHPSFAPEKGFGPFGGQAFIADIAHRNVIRVALEKVAGQYQGAVFPFIRPLQSSSYSTAFDHQGNLWVGSVGRGWTGGDSYIEVIRFDPEKTPFEMQRIQLSKDGFDIHFTQALAKPIEAKEILVTEFRYQYWSQYGSEPFDVKTIPVTTSQLSDDKSTLALNFPRKEGFLYTIQFADLTSAAGLRLQNNYGIYTLNKLLP